MEKDFQRQLTQQQKDDFQAHLTSTVKNLNCGWCGENKWFPVDDFVQVNAFEGRGVLMGTGPTYPCVMTVCGNCGNTMLFNALLIGLLEKADDQEGVTEKGENDGD